jgi:L-malate glycosyltransferase
MKILYFTRNYNSHDHRFLSALAQSEHQVFYLTLEQGSRSLEDRALPPQVEILSWSRRLEQAGLKDGPRLLGELKGILRKIRPDLVQAGPIQRTAFLTALAGFHPLLSMSWGYDLLVDAPRSSGWQRVTRYTLKHSDALLGDCDTIRRLAVSYGMADERIITFPWGIDLQHFSPAAAARRPNPETAPGGGLPSTTQGDGSQETAALSKPVFTLLSTRAWEPVYGVDTLAQGFVMAAQQRPEMRLVMLGGGSQAGLLRQILARVGPLAAGLTSDGRPAAFERVLFPGQAGFADLPRIYRSADLYVAATHSDGTSISLLEAMACGCPALVSDIPGNREWVTPGENGWLFPESDPKALAQAIVLAYDQREKLPSMGCAARQLVEQRADWNKNFPRLFRAYEIAARPA